MRVRSSVQGLLFAPTLVCLFFVLKAFCPASAGSGCFADQFAVPIFLPLVAVYKIFGDSSAIAGQEFLLVIAYWAFIGFLIGLCVDMWRAGGRTEAVQPVSSPVFVKPIAKEVIKPIEPVVVPEPVITAVAAAPESAVEPVPEPKITEPKPVVKPIVSEPEIVASEPGIIEIPKIVTPKSLVPNTLEQAPIFHTAEPAPVVEKIHLSNPLVDYVPPPQPKKDPVNLLDKEEYK